MRVLISFTDSTAMAVVGLAVEGYHGASVQMAEKIEDLVQTILNSDGSPADLIFCEHPTRSSLVNTLLKQKGLKTPLILFDAGSDQSTPVPPEAKILGRVSWSTWTAGLESLLKGYSKLPRPEDITLAPDIEFHQIRTALLVAASPLPADVFIRLSHDKYLKIFQQGDRFDQSDYQRYAHDKRISHFYLRDPALTAFVLKLAQVLEARIKAGMSPDEATHFSEEIHQTVQSLLEQGVATPDVGEMIKSNLHLTLQAIGKKPKLKEVIDRVLQRTSSYMAGHSIALCQITCTLATAMEWGSKGTFSKLNFASFLHDAALDNDELAQISSTAAIQAVRSSQGDATADLVLLHGLKAAELSRSFSEVPPDVDQILIQHHERPDGSGFPRGLTHTQISPMAALFIIAQDLVDEIFKKGSDFSYADFIQSRQETYGMGHFRKLLKAIAKI